MPGSEAQAADVLDTYLACEAGGTFAQTVAHPREAPCYERNPSRVPHLKPALAAERNFAA